MRRIIVCAVLAGGLLVAGASPALAAPRGMGIGAEGAISGLLGDLVHWVQTRFLDWEPAGDRSGDARKNGPEMDPSGLAAVPPGDSLTVGPDMDPNGRAATPPGDRPNTGWEMDPNG